jgi:hypothetical protein
MNSAYSKKLAMAMKCGGMADKKGYKKGGAVSGFKPCKGCPTPAKCKKAGKCLKKK